MMKVDMQYMVDGENTKYLRPRKAERIMSTAKNISKTVYIYGVSGSGKTAFIKDYLSHHSYSYLSAEHITMVDLKNAVGGKNKILVIDDLQFLPMDDLGNEIRNEIIDIAIKHQVWLILCSRCPIPAWLMETYYRQVFIVIEEQELYLTETELKKYFELWQLNITDEEIKIIKDLSYGLGFIAKIVAVEFSTAMANGKRLILDDKAIARIRQHFWDYLEYRVYNQWEPEMREFFMEVSIVDTFNVRLAEMITCRNDVEKMISTAMQTGNFIIQHLPPTFKDNDNSQVIYEIRRGMKRSMRRILAREYTTEYCQKLYYNAGMYYELVDNAPKALKMYELCHNTERIAGLLIGNARKHPGSGHYYELRKYYLELSEDKVKASVELMSVMSLLQSMLLNVEESERWYNELKRYAEEHGGSDKRVAKSKLVFLDISLPHRGSMGMVKLLRNAGELMVRRDIILPEMSVTSNLPSMMNGGKDFCHWSKHDRKLAASIGKIVEFTLEKYGKGLVNIALAESFLEKGGDSYEISTLANKGHMQAEAGGKIEQCFDAVGQLSWLHVLNDHKEEAEELLKSFYQKAVMEGATKLLPNIKTMQIRMSLYGGYNVEAIRWLNEEAPDVDKEFCTLERYRYMAEVRIYIMIGRYEKAVTLLQKMLYYAEEMGRTYIRMESNLLLAIVQYRMQSDLWEETLQNTLNELESYHFVRLITREGAAINKLLEETKWQPKDEKYWKQVKSEAKKIALTYPSYLKMGTEEIILSHNAIKVLKLLSQGMSREEIAKKLGYTIANVKYHINQAYRKLGVKDKAAAVTEAKKHKII